MKPGSPRRFFNRLAACLMFLVARPSDAGPALPGDVPCGACIRIRVGLPRVVRGPGADLADNRFTELRLAGGDFRGFDAHGDTRAIDGHDPMDMGGPERTVLRPGKPGTYDSCGQWLNHVERTGGETLGFVHAETACAYELGQTHKSMSVATSHDDGLSWTTLGQIITGTDSPAAREVTGEGDCTAVNGNDGFYYAYCVRARDGGLIVARAPVTNVAPGAWMKYFGGRWDQPGLGGDATRLMNGSGASVARWTATGELVMTGWVRGGLGLFVTRDHTTLTALPAPILSVDPGQWKRPAPSELISYPVLLDAKTGANQLSNSWLLVYAYVAPNETGNQKYLVFRDVSVAATSSAASPQVGVLLARWYDPTLHDRWSTTAPVPGNGTSYRLETQSGYLMTIAAADRSTVELEDCVSERPGHPDHLLAEHGLCAARGYRRLRTAGWVFAAWRPDTVPLYRCYDDTAQAHFASNFSDCEKLGHAERLLGYALKD